MQCAVIDIRDVSHLRRAHRCSTMRQQLGYGSQCYRSSLNKPRMHNSSPGKHWTLHPINALSADHTRSPHLVHKDDLILPKIV